MTRTDPSLHERARHAPRVFVNAALLAMMALLGLSCGELGGLADNGGMSGTGVSSGPITGYGSIFVNDVEWEIGSAMIMIDGVPAGEADLRIGMVARVEGAFAPGGNSGTASVVVVDDAVEGPIDANPTPVSPSIVQLTIFGVKVTVVDGVTQFENGASFTGLMAGDVVEVSGLIDETGAIVATRIELKPMGATDVELKGVVSNLMQNISEFMLGNVTVVYDVTPPGVTKFEDDLTPQTLTEGQLVEVKGVWFAAQNRIEAQVIELEESGIGVDDADELKLRGFVSGFAGNADFMVSGVSVDASGAAFEPSSLVVMDGVYVEIEGKLVGGQLMAEKVELEDIGDQDNDIVRIRAEVPAGGIAAFGPNTLSMLAAPGGVEVQVPATTQFDDDRDSLPSFGFGDIAEGDRLEIRASLAAGNAVVSTRIKRASFETDTVLQGPVTALAQPSIEILGRTIALAPGVEYEDIDESSLTQSEFFSALQVGDVVKAKDEDAVSTSGFGSADELSIEQLQ